MKLIRLQIKCRNQLYFCVLAIKKKSKNDVLKICTFKIHPQNKLLRKNLTNNVKDLYTETTKHYWENLNKTQINRYIMLMDKKIHYC